MMPTDGAGLAWLTGPEPLRAETPEPVATPTATRRRARRWVPWQTWDAAAGCPGALHGPRRDLADGRKAIPWPEGARPAELVYFATPDHRPPAPGSRLVLTEGEKAADAVAAAGYLAAATVCGAAAQPSDAVVELLAQYRVILAADADELGERHMRALSGRLEAAGVPQLYRVDAPADAPKGWDLADVELAERSAILEAARELLLLPPAAPDPGGSSAGPLEGRTWPEPEDRGAAVLSELGDVEYVEDLVRPGRIVVVAAEEGTGKSYAITGELAIRMAIAGGAFAGTWPILRTGPVLVLSEMHADDDFAREAAILEGLELERSALAGRYFRLPLMTAAGGPPALTVAPWREWVTGWLRDRGALLLVIDTATGATQVDPWGQAIQAVYRDLRAMLEAYPDLAIILVLHLKKPQGRGDRRISDVLGEWGRWCDVVMMLEADGATRTKLATLKRVRRQRRIVATRADGLLVDPVDLEASSGAKVKPDAVLAAIVASPGVTYEALGEALGVSKRTAARYVKELGEAVDVAPGTARSGPGSVAMVFAVASSRQVETATGDATVVATPEVPGGSSRHRDTHPIGVSRDVTRRAPGPDDGMDEGTAAAVLPPPAAVPVEPADLFALATRPPCFGDAELYRAHQVTHYDVESDALGCRACEGAEVPS